MGAGVDPKVEGLVTGEEALELAGELHQEAKNLGYYANESGEGCESAKCELFFESGENEDKGLANSLEECYHQVHNPGYVHGHSYTKTCLVQFGYSFDGEDDRVVQPGRTVSLCFSYRVTPSTIVYSSSSWWCESDQQWRTFNNRGWWLKY